ncbi:MAG: 30S ribosomal protein S12 methylthiotransferase RimO [Gammaproteobacteria bacterium]|nr:30S ribosomal protein S12 methylthiotransferase RimO [Gammaproteobacteria bacterium]MDD9895576.1 30S ribosomal protein S12 methylthiotransferase RimO [Gammaproteobacteria bacterium]
MSEKSSQPEKKVGFVSLGCPKALVDSERILTQLRMDGYSIVPSYDDADIVVVNTCGFIDSAKEESLQAIGEALDENGKVIVTGCLGKQADLITSTHPKVLGVTGPQAYEEVVTQVRAYVPPPEVKHDPYADLVPPQGIKLTPRHYAYLKISEGCNHRCSFCIIPSMRGDLVSRPIGEVLDEAERLVNAGVKELLVISQDTSAYGVDTKYQTGFWQGRPLKSNIQGLCEALGELGVWVRLHYVYPYPHVDKIIPLMAENRILPYLDIPFQHASLNILKAMRRPAATEKTLKRIEQWRSDLPHLAIRSTFIVGFPGESDEDFEALLDFLRAAKLDRVGCFQYSPVNGAAANELPNHVADELKAERWNRFMATQQEISISKLADKIGTSADVIIDQVNDEGVIGRSTADAPEIDGLVYIETSEALEPGDIITVQVNNANEYDLFATF